jgi:hypothetical protein
MNRLVARFGKLITISFALMALGIFVFLLSLPLYTYFEIDTDILGFIIFVTGLAVCLTGILRRKKLERWKVVLLSFLATLFSLPMLALIVSLFYLLITGKELGT